MTGITLQLDLLHEASELRLGQTIFLLVSEVWKTMVPLFIHLTQKWGEKKELILLHVKKTLYLGWF